MISSRFDAIQTIAIAGTLALLVLASCSSRGNSDAAASSAHDPDGYPGGDILVTAEWVAANLDDPDLRIVDLSPIRSYRDGHLPGAVHIWWQDTIEIHNEVYGMLAWGTGVPDLIETAGITQESFVVVYDDNVGHNAARFLWMLHAIGFYEVALLNGGRQAWEEAGFSLTTDRPDVDPGGFPWGANYDVLIGADDVQAALDDPDTVIVDGRSEADRGETWFDHLRTGQIPGSIHLPRDETTQDGEVPYFLSPDELQSILPDGLEPGDDRTIIVYGLHSVAAAHTYVTLRLLGFDHVRLYDGSWAEWGADPERPIEELPGG
jgi:thiosulfate/3-mercaptopyruvate sulfurtransferase